MPDLRGASSNNSSTYWLPKKNSLRYQPLTADLDVDVLVVGGGIAGLSAGYALQKAGKKVAIVEDGFIAGGETGRTSAHLATCVDGGFARVHRGFGLETARLVAESHQMAIGTLQTFLKDENIDADFKHVSGYLFSPASQRGLEEEARVLTDMTNVPFGWTTRAPITSFDTGRCLVFQEQAQFHPVKYCYGIAEAFRRRGGQIYEETHVTSFVDGEPCQAVTESGLAIRAQNIIVATNSPVNDRVTIHSKQAQYRTYVVGVAIPKGIIEEALYWDTAEPYHYLRTLPSSEADLDHVLIGGGDHRTGENSPAHAFAALRRWIKARFSSARFLFEWSGQIVEPFDGLAFIGRNPFNRNIYIHTGMSGNGLTYGLLASQVLRDLILGRGSPYADIYSPSRVPLKACGQAIRETTSTFCNYRDWLLPHTHHKSQLKETEGRIERRGLAIDAVYKDENGNLHRMSAICPHLGGIVRFNDVEKTWDCPCHGSRFTALGRVIDGPANTDLTKKR